MATKDKDELKKQEFNRKILLVSCVLNVINKTLSRYKKYGNDPVTRYALFLDKFCIILDIAMSALEGIVCDESESFPLELRGEVRKTVGALQDEISNLCDFVQSPHLAPDMHAGRVMMTEAKKDFDDKFSNTA